MSTLVISYDGLEDASVAAKNTAKVVEDYCINLEKKVCQKISDYSGGQTEYINNADIMMHKKLQELNQKKMDLTTLSTNIDVFEEICEVADQNVANAIDTLTGDFKKTYGIGISHKHSLIPHVDSEPIYGVSNSTSLSMVSL